MIILRDCCVAYQSGYCAFEGHAYLFQNAGSFYKLLLFWGVAGETKTLAKTGPEFPAASTMLVNLISVLVRHCMQTSCAS